MNKDEKPAHTIDEVFRKFFDLSLDFFVVLDTTGHVARYNRAWEGRLGYTSEEMTGKVILSFVHPDDRERTKVAFEGILTNGELVDYTNRFVTKTGELIYIEWRAFLEGDLVYCVARDVTKRVQTEIELKESKETYRFITENMTDVIWIMDPITMEFKYLSPSVERLRGFTVDEVMKQSIDEVVTPGSAETIAEVLQAGMQSYLNTGEFYE